MSDRRAVLDASAVVAWAIAEDGAAAISRVLDAAVVPVTTLIEAIAKARAKGHRLEPDQILARIRAAGSAVEPVTESEIASAAELILYSRAHPAPDGGTLSLGDACCIAVAERLDLPLVADDSVWPTLPIKVPVHNFCG